MRRSSSRLTILVLGAAVVLASGCFLPAVIPAGPAAPVVPAPSGPVGTARWRPCPEVPTELVGRGATGMTYECANIAVPADWAEPDGATIDLALLRARDRRQSGRIGSLVVNPGGPGGSGVDLAVYLSFGATFGGLPAEVTRRFDIVGFDPRGVSRSTPIKCIPDPTLDESFGYEPDPVDQAAFDGAVALAKRIGDACGAKYGEDLVHFSTEQAARDMDAVRAAVGDDKINYLGYSYGTLLGATYAQLFPTKIRAFVLDGAIDPRQETLASFESQARGFERAFDNFAAWCRDNRRQCPIAPDARAAVNAALARARQSPVAGQDGRSATAGWVMYAVVASLYSEDAWPSLAGAIDELGEGDPDEMFQLADGYAERGADGRYSNLFDANSAINCADDDTTVTTDQVRALQSQWRARYPLFGPMLAIGLLSCANWPGPRDPYPTGPATGAPPIVVVGTVGDPATPYEQTPKLAEMLGNAVVLTWEGEGHTAYPDTRCITEAINAYLIDLTVPADGRRCPAR